MLNFTYCVAHGGDKAAEVNHHSEQMLDKLEKEYPSMFSEPEYPIWEQKPPFWIPLVDTSNLVSIREPLHYHLYPSSSEELIALKM